MPIDAAPRAEWPDARPIFRLVGQTRTLLRSTWVATGVGLTAGLLGAALVATTGIDMLVPLPQWLRLTALLLIVVPTAWACFTGVARPLFRRLAPTHVARRIEKQLPGIHNRLVSCIDLEAKGTLDVSPTFHRRLLTEALDRIRAFRPRQVLDLLSLRRASVFALSAAVAFAVAFLLFSDRMPTALARIFLPFADIPPASGVEYAVSPGTADVLREENVTFAATVAKGEPDALRLEMRGAGGAARWFDLSPNKNDPARWKATLDTVSLGEGFQDGFRYRIHGGGTWSKEHAIRLVERPVLVSVRSAVHYPAYMAIPEPLPTPPQATKVFGPEGGTVEVIVQAEGQVASGEVQILAAGERQIPREEQAERVWIEDKPPVGAPVEGAWASETRQKRPAHAEAAGVGSHGHWFNGDPVGHAVTAGDILFAYVYIPAANKPESILLEWHDGDGWEHRAYWGADRFRIHGKAGTASRRAAGPLPDADGWVRLEVPAAIVALEGKTLRGMAFRLHDGQAAFGRTGTVRLVEPTVVVTRSWPMTRNADGEWTGKFPLDGSGLFRAELKNHAGHANKPMKELEFAATPDQPPQVVLERPGQDVVLSQPAAVPLTIAAFDDYGLERIDLLFRASETETPQSRTLRQFPTPERSQTIVAALTEAAKLKQGEQVRFAIEARDRKGQTARTREFVVRVAADANAADQQAANFEKTQDTFRDRLVKLIADQKTVQTSIEKLNKEYAGLTEKLKAAEEAARAESPKVDPTGKPLPPDPASKIDPETVKRLAEVQKELAKLAQQEQANAGTADQLNKDFAKAADDAAKLDLLPKPIADQMKAAQQTFEQMVAQAMSELSRDLARSGDPKGGADPKANANKLNVPDLKGLEQKGDRIAKELEGVKARMDALAKARKDLRDDLAKALEDLKRELAAANGEMTARDLEALRDFIAKLRGDLKDLAAKQDDMANEDAVSDKAKAARAAKTQEEMEKDIEKALADARNLLDKRKARKPRRTPEFPDSPFSGDEEMKVPPREEDTDEALPTKDKEGKAKPGDKNAKKPDAKDDDEEEKKFMPALGGPKEKPDPRFAKKVRPVDKSKNPAQDKQEANAQDLDDAEKALASDQNSVDQMMRRLQEMARGSKQKGKPMGQGDDNDLADQLAEMMKSQALRDALAMAGRMRQGAPQRGKPGQPTPAPAQSQGAGQTGSKDDPAQAKLAQLDPATRAALLKLPPRLREELLQGMEEKGPEGYGPFIQDYFKRLTETKEPPK